MMLFALLVTLFFLAMFTGIEIAYVSTSKLRVELKKQQGGMRSSLVSHFYAYPSRFLGTMLVGNNIALVLFTLILSSMLFPLFPFWNGNEVLMVIVTVLIGTFIVLLFGEFVPKVLFRSYGEHLLFHLAIPIRGMMMLLAIPSGFFTWISNTLLRLFTNQIDRDVDTTFSRLELESLVRDTQSLSDTRIDTDLFGKALHLKLVKVKDCMVPRTEIEAIDISDGLDILRNLFVETKLSRLLVIDGDIDNVLGYVHHQQMLNEKGPIRKMIFQLPVVPETMKVQDLLNLFIRGKTSIACVVDEYGGTSGIITMEDILEQIFGEIEDEHDEEEYIEEKLNETEYRFSGRLEIDYLNEKYPELQFPKGDYHTLSGYLVMTIASIPEEGTELDLDGYRFILEKVGDKKIETVRILCLGDDDDETVDS